jgi:hypothetical protein
VGARPGQGGVDRGRADAEMIWGAESEDLTDAFQSRTLSSAEYLDAERSGLVGVGAAAPEVAPVEESAGLVEVETSGGSAAWRRRLAPRHRSAVRSFFAPRPAGAAGATGAGAEGDDR